MQGTVDVTNATNQTAIDRLERVIITASSYGTADCIQHEKKRCNAGADVLDAHTCDM